MDNSFMYETDTKYIDFRMIGGPSLENEYGSLKDLLKTVLSEGFNLQTPVKVFYNKVESVLELDFEVDHGYVYNQVLQLSGASDSTFNGQFRVKEARTRNIKLAFNKNSEEGIVATVEGLKTRVAPLGFLVVFEDVINKTICFKSDSAKSPGVLKVIDKLPPNGYGTTWNKYSRVVVGKGVDSQGNFIDDEKSPYWYSYPDSENTGNKVKGAAGIHGFAKWDYAIRHSSADVSEVHTERGIYPTDWKIIGDNKTFYLLVRPQGKDNYSYNVLGFGNYISENLEETTNICLQARDGLVDANSNDGNNFSRTRNNFGVLDAPYGGFLLSNIHGNMKPETPNSYRCEGFYIGGPNANRPWKSSELKGLNPVTGVWTTSKIYIKDSDDYLRGYHRGIKLLYGGGSVTDNASSRDGDIVLRVQTPTGDAVFETMPLLFTLRNWESV